MDACTLESRANNLRDSCSWLSLFFPATRKASFSAAAAAAPSGTIAAHGAWSSTKPPQRPFTYDWSHRDADTKTVGGRGPHLATGTKSGTAEASGVTVAADHCIHSPALTEGVGQYEWPRALPGSGDAFALGLLADCERLGELAHHMPHCA